MFDNARKRRNPFLAAFLSIPVPGLGQMYAGSGIRGAAILSIVIIVGNLNAIWLSFYSISKQDTGLFWGDALPRLLHDLFSVYGIIFLIWQVVDAYQQAKETAN